jgi:putative tryptophan/tyrosine transport system substrate-binding protein
MRRREFSERLGCGVAAHSARAGACAAHRHDPASNLRRSRISDLGRAFLQGLAQLGWTMGHNMRIDMRWATANAREIRRQATELVAMAPDVILAHGGSTVGPLLQLTRTVPIVFPVAGDPVGAGSLARPGGNATGL